MTSETVMYMYMVAAGCAVFTAVLFFLDRHMNGRNRRKGQ